jgi:hypothetical protein
MDFVGMLKWNKKNVPRKVKDAKLKKDKLTAWHSSPFSVTKRNYKNKYITGIFTHHNETKTTTKRGKKNTTSELNDHQNKNSYQNGT